MVLVDIPSQYLHKSTAETQVFDPIRKDWFTALPEELVRQSLLHTLVYYLGYPQSLVLVEKKLSELPGSSYGQRLNRRLDTLCMMRSRDGKILQPLLLIECKSIPLNQKSFDQILGYNQFVNAPFLAVINAEECYLQQASIPSSTFEKVHSLPSFKVLSDFVIQT